jgi:hypothetical protein
MLLEASHSAAKRGEFLTAENHAKDAIKVLDAAHMLLNGNARGFEILRSPGLLARGVTEKRYLGREGRLVRAARALIARELVRGGERKRELPYYHRPEERAARLREERRLRGERRKHPYLVTLAERKRTDGDRDPKRRRGRRA